MKSVIERVRDKEHPKYSDEHIAMVTGRRFIPPGHYFRNRKTGQEYGGIVGAIGWPGRRPGYGLVLGVRREGQDSRPTFECLAEVEAKSPLKLLHACAGMRDRWGFHESPDILRSWFAEPDRFLSIWTGHNVRLLKKASGRGLHLAPPFDIERPDAFSIYLSQALTCLEPNKEGRKRLIIGECSILRNQLQAVPQPEEEKRRLTTEDFPAVFAIGAAVHSLLTLKPWMVRTETVRQRLVSTIREEERFYQRAEEESLQALYGDETPSEEGGYDLVSTFGERSTT